MRIRSSKGAGRGVCAGCLFVVSRVMEICFVRERYGKRKWMEVYVLFVCKNAVGLIVLLWGFKRLCRVCHELG